MLVLLDRAFDRNAFLAEIAATGAAPLARARSTRMPAVHKRLPDGSYLSRLDDLEVPIMEAEIAMTGADGSRIADSYRLITGDHAAKRPRLRVDLPGDSPGDASLLAETLAGPGTQNHPTFILIWHPVS